MFELGITRSDGEHPATYARAVGDIAKKQPQAEIVAVGPFDHPLTAVMRKGMQRAMAVKLERAVAQARKARKAPVRSGCQHLGGRDGW